MSHTGVTRAEYAHVSRPLPSPPPSSPSFPHSALSSLSKRTLSLSFSDVRVCVRVCIYRSGDKDSGALSPCGPHFVPDAGIRIEGVVGGVGGFGHFFNGAGAGRERGDLFRMRKGEIARSHRNHRNHYCTISSSRPHVDKLCANCVRLGVGDAAGVRAVLHVNLNS